MRVTGGLRRAWTGAVTGAALCCVPASSEGAAPAAARDRIRLIVRADDMGACHTVNEACVRSFEQGIVRTVEVMVPGPWFPEAAALLRDRPQLDVGVHLTLNSEWTLCKWGPVTASPSLADRWGHFRPMPRQRADFPPDTGFLDAGPRLDEVERELRAQIEIAREAVPQLSHITSHMGTAVATPELRALVERLAQEYQLPLEASGVRHLGGWSGAERSAEEKTQALVALLEGLAAGDWLIIEHPGADTAEMRALGHPGYENVAADRAGVTAACTSEAVRAVIARRGIELIAYRDLAAR